MEGAMKISLFDEIDSTLKHYFLLDGEGDVMVEEEYVAMVVKILHERIKEHISQEDES